MTSIPTYQPNWEFKKGDGYVEAKFTQKLGNGKTFTARMRFSGNEVNEEEIKSLYEGQIHDLCQAHEIGTKVKALKMNSEGVIETKYAKNAKAETIKRQSWDTFERGVKSTIQEKKQIIEKWKIEHPDETVIPSDIQKAQQSLEKNVRKLKVNSSFQEVIVKKNPVAEPEAVPKVDLLQMPLDTMVKHFADRKSLNTLMSQFQEQMNDPAISAEDKWELLMHVRIAQVRSSHSPAGVEGSSKKAPRLIERLRYSLAQRHSNQILQKWSQQLPQFFWSTWSSPVQAKYMHLEKETRQFIRDTSSSFDNLTPSNREELILRETFIFKLKEADLKGRGEWNFSHFLSDENRRAIKAGQDELANTTLVPTINRDAAKIQESLKRQSPSFETHELFNKLSTLTSTEFIKAVATDPLFTAALMKALEEIHAKDTLVGYLMLSAAHQGDTGALLKYAETHGDAILTGSFNLPDGTQRVMKELVQFTKKWKETELPALKHFFSWKGKIRSDNNFLLKHRDSLVPYFNRFQSHPRDSISQLNHLEKRSPDEFFRVLNELPEFITNAYLNIHYDRYGEALLKISPEKHQSYLKFLSETNSYRLTAAETRLYDQLVRNKDLIPKYLNCSPALKDALKRFSEGRSTRVSSKKATRAKSETGTPVRETTGITEDRQPTRPVPKPPSGEPDETNISTRLSRPAPRAPTKTSPLKSKTPPKRMPPPPPGTSKASVASNVSNEATSTVETKTAELTKEIETLKAIIDMYYQQIFGPGTQEPLTSNFYKHLKSLVKARGNPEAAIRMILLKLPEDQRDGNIDPATRLVNSYKRLVQLQTELDKLPKES